MIEIKSLVEYAEAEQNGKKFLVESLGGSEKVDFDETDVLLPNFKKAIADGRIFIKPEEIKLLHEYRSPNDLFIYSQDQHLRVCFEGSDHNLFYFKKTGRVLRDGVIEESE